MQAAPVSQSSDTAQETPSQPEPPPTPDELLDPAPATVNADVAAPVADAIPAQKNLAVIVTLETDGSILTPESTLAVTVTVRAESDLPTDKADLTLILPKGIATTAGDKNKVTWPLSLLSGGQEVIQRVDLQIDKVNQALKREVGILAATVTAPTYPAVESTTLLAFAPTPPGTEDIQDATGAVIASSDGEVVLLAQPDVAPAGVIFHYRELYNWETVSSTGVRLSAHAEVSLTATVAAPITIGVEAPANTGLTMSDPVTTATAITVGTTITAGTTISDTTPTTDTTTAAPVTSEVAATPASTATATAPPAVKKDHNLDAYRVWQLDALQDGQNMAALGGEVLVQVSVKKLIKAGVDPTSLALWTREGAEGRWTPVPTVYHDKQQRLQAWLPHFSQFGLGAGLQQSGDMLPSVKAFTVDQLNGGASVSIGIDTPKGLGGLSPNLSLSYSSITMDDLFREAGSNEIEAQAGSAGIGWHLGGVSYIARTDTKYDDDNPNTEKTFALVLNGTRVSIAWQDGKWRTNPEIFAKLDWSGIAGGSNTFNAYDFSGWTVWTGDGTKYEFGDAGPFPMAFSGVSPTATALERTYGNRTFRLAKRWYLRKVTDTLGNTMEYNYQGEQGWETGCVDDDWETAWQHWYTRSIDPSAIYWSGQGVNYTMRVLFSYTSRTDTYVKGDATNDCLQPLYGSNNRLTAVTVQVISGGSWQTLRSYSLGQGTWGFGGNKNRLYLNTLDQLGKSGGLLQRYNFTYDFYNPNHVLLNAASTNFGGSVTYGYGSVRASCSNSTCPHSMNRYAVTQQIAYDGLGNYRAVHHYYGPGTPGDEWSAVGNDGGFMGYKEVQSKYYTANSLSTELRRERLLSYSSGAAADRDNPDPRRGKLLRREVWTQSVGGTLLQATDYDWKAYWLENYAWQSTPTAASWRVINNQVVYPITWIKLEKETTTVGSAVNEKRYSYEGAYGNQTRASEWGNNSNGSQDVTIRTSYDTAYRLFPIEQWYDASPAHKETATYYGVNGLSATDSKAFWGAMQEHCGVNDVCTRQSYDEFGRRVYRWEAVIKGSSWGSDANAQVFWAYTPYGNGQTATTVLEWRNPRGEGNFVRKLYNGLGELIQEHRAYQNWTASNGQEIITDYLYDALGRQTRVGMPWLIAKFTGGTADTRRATTWVNGFTATSYDAIGRITGVTAPNGEQQQYGYVARQMSITGIGRNGDSNKILKWQETDGLGHLKEVRTYNPNGSNWALDGQVILTHNVLGNLTQVNHVGVGTSSFTYDVGGRKTAMSDINLGSWSYAYDRQGKLTRQTDARNATICLYYDGMARLAGKHFRNDTNCPGSTSYNVTYAYDQNHSSTNRSRGQLTGVSNTGYAKSLDYNSQGLLAQETVNITGAPGYYYTNYGYDSYLRPVNIIYPDGETVTTGYNSMGLPSWLHSNVSGTFIDSVSYDEASRLTQRRSALSGQFYSQTYWPWTGSANNTNGRWKEIRLGSSSGASNLLYYLYGYDSFGNIGGMSERYNNGTTSTYTFGYDAQNRLTSGYGRAYSYDSAGRLTNYEGAGFTVAGIRPHLALPAGGSYAIDSNGNLTNRQSHALTWNHENRLESYYRATPYLYETYLYDVDGIRVRKTTNGVNTFYPNRFYEQTGTAVTKYYYFAGQRVAMRQGSTTPLIYLYGDHVGSTAYATHDGGTFITEQGYWGYGRYRRGGALPTDQRFTGQKLDGSGLMYYNARYYDPELGQFLSPDTLVPDPGNLFDYNRYMYVRGNPMNAIDPSGHICVPVVNIGNTCQGSTDWDAVQSSLDATGIVDPTPISDGVNAVISVARGNYVDAGLSAVAIVPYVGDLAKGGKYLDEAAAGVKWVGDKADEGWQAAKRWTDCLINSFSAKTLVMTPSGLKAISELVEGELVLAYNEATGEIGAYPITDVISHVDPEIVLLTIDDETLETTAEHPFYELEAAPWLAVGQTAGRWTDAIELQAGDRVWKADGTNGVVQTVAVVPAQQRMYNLTVAEAHTFFVGEQQWLVHNACDFNYRAGTTAEITGKKGTYTLSFDELGNPDFSSHAIAEVQIDMKGNYTSDFTQANKASGFTKTPDGYTWHHHQDGKTMQLVPTDLHKRVYHHGGVKATKNH